MVSGPLPSVTSLISSRTNRLASEAENHYAADYPEDEVDSDDEYGRHAYYYRNANTSDDEQFDNNNYNSDSDDMVLGGDNDDAATMAKIKAYMQRYREG